MRRRWIIAAILLTACLAALAFEQSISITSPRPLNDASVRLERTFGVPVTYEEAMRVWPGELASRDGSPPKKWGGLIPPKWDLYPKLHTFRMPVPGSDMEQSVRRTVDAFNQSSNGVRFEVLRSKYGLHIVQRGGHDEHGALTDIRSLLDVSITIPAAGRTPPDHLRAVEAAITAATKTKIAIEARLFQMNGFNGAYNARLHPFIWDARSMVARDALIDLLGRSSNKYSWRLNCQSSTQPADRFCALNFRFVEGTSPNLLPH